MKSLKRCLFVQSRNITAKQCPSLRSAHPMHSILQRNNFMKSNYNNNVTPTDEWFANRLEIHSDKFSCLLDDGIHSATLLFSKKKDLESGSTSAIYDFHHVEVPQAYKGKGIAMPFSKACFDHALQNDWKVKVTCAYLKRKFLGEYHGLYENILVE